MLINLLQEHARFLFQFIGMIPFNTSFEKLKEIVISHEKIIVNANNLDEYFGI